MPNFVEAMSLEQLRTTPPISHEDFVRAFEE
jgi:hypothetical protein